MPKKGSRKVTFEGKEYRYLIKEIGISWDKALSVTIQEVTDKPGRVVQFKAVYGHPIYKHDIELNIKRALKCGWKPNERGAALILGDLTYAVKEKV